MREKYSVGIITLSDRGARGERTDESGPLIRERLLREGVYEICEELLLSDDPNQLEAELIRMADRCGWNLILTTGGTGFAPRDHAPEATEAVITKRCPGIAEYLRMRSMEITPRGMLSRGAAGIRNRTLIVNLPGSPKAVRESLEWLLPSLEHGLDILLERARDCAEREAQN